MKVKIDLSPLHQLKWQMVNGKTDLDIGTIWYMTQGKVKRGNTYKPCPTPGALQEEIGKSIPTLISAGISIIVEVEDYRRGE